MSQVLTTERFPEVRSAVPRPDAARLILPLLGLIALGSLLRFAGLARDSYWLDEAATLVAASQPSPGVVLWYAFWNDTHPFLLHMLLHYWSLIGYTEFITRFLPAMFGILTVPVCFWFGRMLGGKLAGLLAGGLLAISPYHIAYSQELRMYSLVTLLSLLAAGFYWKWLEKGSDGSWWAFNSCIVLAAYADQSAGLVYIALTLHFLLVGWRSGRSWRRWIAGTTAVVILTIPPLLYFTMAMLLIGPEAFNWVSSPSPAAVLTVLQAFSVGYSVPNEVLPGVMVVFGLGVILALAGYRRMPQAYLLLAMLAFLPVLLLYLVSMLVCSQFVERALLPSLPAYVTLVSLGLLRVALRPLTIALLGAVLLLTGVSLFQYYTCQAERKADLRAAADYIKERAVPTDIILHTSPMTYESFLVYGRLLDRMPARQFSLMQEKCWQTFQKAHSSPQARTSEGGARRFFGSQPLYATWRQAGREYEQKVLDIRGASLSMLPELLPDTTRVMVVSLTPEGIRKIGRQTVSTRDGWRHPCEVEWSPGSPVPGFRLVQTRTWRGVRMEQYER